ncbi:pyridoxal phosphate-dependent transferase [Pilobolus umbonatus]|nr:pyridoxal phosphate-dependent transferase [Pilobolus umbonatus]
MTSSISIVKIPEIFDLTSDTATQPTDDMFDIMKKASRHDDVFEMDGSVKNLENEVAELLGHESALFCASGCMTNQIGLRLLLIQPPHSVMVDARAHVYNYECGGIAYHSQASISPVVPRNGHHLTVEDVSINMISDTLCSAVTKVISLENTLNGTIMPIDEIRRIREFTQEKGLKLHMDGARLWNASQATGISLKEYGQYFDTLSLCVSKGVGAPIGSLLVSNRENIKLARHLRKLMGGGWRQAGSLAAAAQHCIENVVPTMPETHRITKKLADAFINMGMRLSVPCETNMVFLDTATTGVSIHSLAESLLKENILINNEPGNETRLVLHYQITEEAVDTIIEVASRLDFITSHSSDTHFRVKT